VWAPTGETGEYSYNITNDPVHVRDVQAALLNQFGIGHDRIACKYQGLAQRLTGTGKAPVVRGILS
jgi:hypothetical protein